MKTVTYRDLSREHLKKAIGAYGTKAFGKIYKVDDDEKCYVTELNSAGQVVLCQVGQDPDTVDSISGEN